MMGTLAIKRLNFLLVGKPNGQSKKNSEIVKWSHKECWD